MSGEDFLLKWNDHHTLFFSGAEELWQSEECTDVTLAAGAKLFPAHRLVLSVCSPYFRKLFRRLGTDKPVIYLKDVDARHMELLLNYMYKGEINVEEQELVTVLNTAQGLEIRGLTQPDKPDNRDPPVHAVKPKLPKEIASKTAVTPTTNISNSQTLNNKKRKFSASPKTPMFYNVPSLDTTPPHPIDIVKQEVPHVVEDWNTSQSDQQMAAFDNDAEFDYDDYEAEYTGTMAGQNCQPGLRLNGEAKAQRHSGSDDSAMAVAGEPDDRVVSVTLLVDGQQVTQWQCAVCGKTSKWKPVISRHLVTHTGAKDFLCQFCNQAFGVASNKSRHEKRCEFRTF